MKWSWIFDIAFEVSTAANSRFCTTTNAKRSCQKVWSVHPNRWIQGEKRSVGGHRGRRWIWGWCDVNLDPTGPLILVGLLLNGNITISTMGEHEFIEHFDFLWMPTGVYRSRGLSRYWGLSGISRNTRDRCFGPREVFPLGIRLGPRGCKDREIRW